MWEIEEWWECKGGTIHSRDIWKPLHIIANLTRASIPNTYDINFSSNLNKTDITLNDLLVTVSSKYNIKYTWTATYINDKTLRVSIITNFVLIGDETVTIKFISYKIFRGPYGGWLSVDSVTSIANNNLVDSEQTVLSMSAFLQYSTYTGILVTLVLIILGGGSMEIFWALLSSMQLITFLPLMTPYFPGHVRIMFQMLKFSNMNFDFMSDAFTALLPFDFGNIAAYSEVFTENGISTPLFLKKLSINIAISDFIHWIIHSFTDYFKDWLIWKNSQQI